ncbi:hypothetical protein F4778DRAFT_722561 [Xylariomycetidae sp. FL2044]|nr:hypothetical protein F4778DRAFT_722561 [Xylariomycetidae sp. FL2044]
MLSRYSRQLRNRVLVSPTRRISPTISIQCGFNGMMATHLSFGTILARHQQRPLHQPNVSPEPPRDRRKFGRLSAVAGILIFSLPVGALVISGTLDKGTSGNLDRLKSWLSQKAWEYFPRELQWMREKLIWQDARRTGKWREACFAVPRDRFTNAGRPFEELPMEKPKWAFQVNKVLDSDDVHIFLARGLEADDSERGLVEVVYIAMNADHDTEAARIQNTVQYILDTVVHDLMKKCTLASPYMLVVAARDHEKAQLLGWTKRVYPSSRSVKVGRSRI